MANSIFLLFHDPAEVDPLTEAPAYLRGAFGTRESAEHARSELCEEADDPRWMIVEEELDVTGWLEGFVTVRRADPFADTP